MKNNNWRETKWKIRVLVQSCRKKLHRNFMLDTKQQRNARIYGELQEDTRDKPCSFFVVGHLRRMENTFFCFYPACMTAMRFCAQSVPSVFEISVFWSVSSWKMNNSLTVVYSVPNVRKWLFFWEKSPWQFYQGHCSIFAANTSSLEAAGSSNRAQNVIVIHNTTSLHHHSPILRFLLYTFFIHLTDFNWPQHWN